MKKNSYIKDINSNYLYENDIVNYVVMRCSSSYSTWGKFTNKEDGYYKIKGKIIFKDNGFYIIGDDNDINNLKIPKGKERDERNVWHKEFLLSEYVECYLGKKFSKGYIEKIINYKKKKVVLSRLEVLGIT
ncbi:MAG: hypothetical protein M0Q13_15690 [Methanothrix sp.]|jgi:hypothetical protein|nr:hypothetical protein [Methanothrix sp.]